MNKNTLIGLDLAKERFHLVERSIDGKHTKKRLSRQRLKTYFANREQCVIAMEACSGAHYWGRLFISQGHTVKLLPAQHVKPLVMGNKNDYNDATAIVEALSRPRIHPVTVKTEAQQDRQLLDTQRQQYVQDRTRQANRVRAMLLERGPTIARGIAVLYRAVPTLLARQDHGLSPLFIEQLRQALQHLRELDDHVKQCDRRLTAINRSEPQVRELMVVPGFGPIVSSLFYSYVGNGSQYRRGPDVSASLGLVPGQHSTGGKERLLGISKRGNKQLRTLLIHGARAAVARADGKGDRISRWIQATVARIGFNKAVVAYANKMARIGWAILHYQRPFDPHYAHSHAV